MEAYKPYVDYIMAGSVAETAYILTKEGAICGTNLPIQALPQYNFELEDENDPTKKHNIVVDERVNLLEAVKNKGVCKHKQGLRLYNQKYYTVNYEPADEKKSFESIYLKKNKGGACVCVTKTFIIIGTFNIEIKMFNGVPQNPGELNKRVQELASNLSKQGY